MTATEEEIDANEVDKEFSRRVSALKRKHKTDDAFLIPRDEWYELQTWRHERYAIAHGRDPITFEKTAGRLKEERLVKISDESEGVDGTTPTVGSEETLTCEKCGSTFTRVRTRGRKPRFCEADR